MKLLKVNTRFIEEHIDELVQLVDYVPISFKDYHRGYERDKFLKSKNLLITMQEMNELIRQKCNHYEDPVKAYNSVLIEWLDCHPEFEGMISSESIVDYQKMRDNTEYLSIVELLSIELPSEVKPLPNYVSHDDVIHKDDSRIMFPDFKKMNEVYDKYGYSLLSAYLAYLV